ncbi:hypothetical protein B7H01_20870 [Pandoraea apista]|nr:hypothetical protein B7H01_20870 [Pandoraea apista]
MSSIGVVLSARVAQRGVTCHSIVRPVGREMNFLPSGTAMQTGAPVALPLLSPISSRLPALVPLGGRWRGGTPRVPLVPLIPLVLTR